MKALRKIMSIDKYLGVLALFVMVTLVLIHVFCRLIGSPLVWAEEVERYLLICMVYLSIGFTARHGGHISFDSVLNNMPPKLNKVVNIIINLLCIAVFAIITYSSVITMMNNLNNKTPVVGIPFVVFMMPLTIGFALSCIEAVLKLLNVPVLEEEKKIF
ncbi:MAG: TRAP transporter small permease [Eubacteriales bacterium]|jgi:TRAP-type C4-dicarboxylate transport system permease small subunit